MERNCGNCINSDVSARECRTCSADGVPYPHWAPKKATVEVDTREIRGTWASLQKKGFNVIQVIYELCDEVDRLRDKLDAGNKLCKKAQEHIGEVHARNNQLTAEVARLREKAGESRCEKCGTYEYVHRVFVEVDSTAHGGQRPIAGDFCQTCLDRALDALKGR